MVRSYFRCTINITQQSRSYQEYLYIVAILHHFRGASRQIVNCFTTCESSLAPIFRECVKAGAKTATENVSGPNGIEPDVSRIQHSELCHYILAWHVPINLGRGHDRRTRRPMMCTAVNQLHTWCFLWTLMRRLATTKARDWFNTDVCRTTLIYHGYYADIAFSTFRFNGMDLWNKMDLLLGTVAQPETIVKTAVLGLVIGTRSNNRQRSLIVSIHPKMMRHRTPLYKRTSCGLD